MKNRPEELDALKKEIEEKSGISIESRKDFQKLHFWIDKQITELNESHGFNTKKTEEFADVAPSPDTLMRVWEYVKYDGEILTKTWSSLAKSIGYLGWKDFQEKIAGTYTPPVPTKKEIFDNQMKEIRLLLENNIPNDSGIYTLGWEPVKYSKLKHLGGFEFEVIESKNMYRQPGSSSFLAPDFKLSEDIGKMGLKDIMIYDYDGDYFDNQPKGSRMQFDEDYFYL